MPATDKVSDGTTKARKRKEKLTEDQMKAHMQEVNNLKFINMFVVCACHQTLPLWESTNMQDACLSDSIDSHSTCCIPYVLGTYLTAAIAHDCEAKTCSHLVHQHCTTLMQLQSC